MRGLLIAAFAIPCAAQVTTLQIFSEFTRLDPFGKIVKQDKGNAEPRHILSPGVPRNAFSSLRIVVSPDKPGKYILDIGQNPENAVTATLYKERFEKHGEQWIPDGLEPVKIPYEATFPDSEIPGQTAVTFWLDMWVPRNSAVDRIKVEPQLWVEYANDWFTYPMEVRILPLVIPDLKMTAAALPEVAERSDAAALAPLRAKLCSLAEKKGEAEVSARAFVRRNALQYAALPVVVLKENLGAIPKLWCSGPVVNASGPEWFLRFRDAAVRAASPRD